jgi:hypothetical protein
MIKESPSAEKVLNVSKTKSKTYDAQMSQIGQEEIEYDMQGTKIFAMLINHLREKVQFQLK